MPDDAPLRAAAIDLDATAAGLLGASYVGLYVTGSVALGSADEHSDLDVVLVTTERVASVAGLVVDPVVRGVCACLADLRSPMTVGRTWPTIGGEIPRWTNTAHGRWLLREHGLVVSGPPLAGLVAAHSPASLFGESIGVARALAARVEEEPELLADATSRSRLVLTLCRVLYTASEGAVAGKQAAVDWALPRVDLEFHELIRAALADRTRDPSSASTTLAVPARAFAHELVRMVSS